MKDGVVKWYYERTSTKTPVFFKQLQEIFNIIISSQKKLPFGKSVAFLVGVSEYEYISQQLPAVRNDLEDMRNFLLFQGGFDVVYVAEEKIVNRDLIEKYIKEILPNELNENDRLLFYFSGHGDDNKGNTGYMQFAKARPGKFHGDQVMQINDSKIWCSELKARHLVFMFDCCASGLAFKEKGGSINEYEQLIATLSESGSHTIVTAGTGTDKTFVVKNSKGRENSLFTRTFLDVIKSGVADKERYGLLILQEIIAHVRFEIAKFRMQHNKDVTPQILRLDNSEFKGDFVFINPRAKKMKTQLRMEFLDSLGACPKGQIVGTYGIIQIYSHVSGRVYIDGNYNGEITRGFEVRYPKQKTGRHDVEIRTGNDTYSAKVDVKRGKISPLTIGAESDIPIDSSDIVAKHPGDSLIVITGTLKGRIIGVYGIIQIESYVTGPVYIDGKYCGKIARGVEIRYPRQRPGFHTVEIRTKNYTYTKIVEVTKGTISLLTIGHESEDIPVIQPELSENKQQGKRLGLYSGKKRLLSERYVEAVIKKFDFFCIDNYWNKTFSNPQGKGFANQFKSALNNQVVCDLASGLIWQQGGSKAIVTYSDAQKYIESLNAVQYAGFSDWRLPTLVEALTLIEPKRKNRELFIDSIFNNTQGWIWTSDHLKENPDFVWVVDFFIAACDYIPMDNCAPYVRAVRSKRSSR